mmetsp:Transcript_13461/g.28809  ORF Transcript_13461/g.28809 Transcript_13461/m.28809 type:complete len:130 (-) Transcript_13461:401-790(-)|eukprot:CAMPEP_0202892018 /NCGR_PEP_ID=MMETSP1392-20130828/1887_1 /ASSEMBLY_ACC=CAM_ASM_000868 /TAXON_ID=225041 /ORGANISM="Chlamydomonas chlamydogama, Strain SAG 11-48b" /LENGTH=129 /DNA_ID=CAMNT_0049575893 /DNA_START=57 /DNA_END=446 /DNA_ORIENTATION=+
MKFSLPDDDTFMKMSMVGTGVFGAHCAFPKASQDFYYTEKAGRNDAAQRWVGFTMLSSTALQGVMLGNNTTPEGKKNACKVMGIAWLAAAGLGAYHNQQGVEKRNALRIAQLTGMGLFGATQLYKGLKK